MFVINIKMVYTEFVAAFQLSFVALCVFVFLRTSVCRLVTGLLKQYVYFSSVSLCVEFYSLIHNAPASCGIRTACDERMRKVSW
jgi:hypothetical protein